MGNILTSLHVVDGATEIEVIFVDGTVAPAWVTAREPETDIAVLRVRVPPQSLVPAALGNLGALAIGDEVVAVGNPFGLALSASSGVVSGLKRNFVHPETSETATGLMPFDAAVNPGNSGGPLLNRNGEVVGIVNALLNPFDQRVFIGIGFAVPTLRGAPFLDSMPEFEQYTLDRTGSMRLISRYQKRPSGPLLDGIDIHVEAPRVSFLRLSDERRGEPLAVM